MKKKMLQCTNWKHTELRLVSHSTSSLCFWEVHWNTNLLLLFASRRDVAISEYQFWNVTVFQTVRLSLFCQCFSFQTIGRSWGPVFLTSSKTLQSTLQHKCKLHQSSANIALVLSHSFPNDTHPMAACPLAQGVSRWPGILAPLLSPNKPYNKITRKVILQFTLLYTLSI